MLGGSEMKGIILAGGTGTRLYPLTKLMNKHLIPVGKYPMVSYGIDRLRSAGITDIFMIIGKISSSLYIEYYGSGHSMGVHITYAIQEEAGGIAQALSLTEPYLRPNEKFVVLLGDNLFLEDLTPYVKAFCNQSSGEARIMLKKVENPHRYGIAVFDNEHRDRVANIQEKPEHPASPYCVTGIYMYDTEVFRHIRSITPSSRGELEITDVNNCYAQTGKLQYNVLQRWWIDAGTFDSLFEASQQLWRVRM